MHKHADDRRHRGLGPWSLSGWDGTNVRRGLGWLAFALTVGCALTLMRREARRLVREHEDRQIQDWEGEGGATATQAQVPGTPLGAQL